MKAVRGVSLYVTDEDFCGHMVYAYEQCVLVYTEKDL